MNVEYNTLCDIEKMLKRIEDDINLSNNAMKDAIERSSTFLSGQQFEKAKSVTDKSLKLSKKCSENLIGMQKYISELICVLEEYDKYGYEEA